MKPTPSQPIKFSIPAPVKPSLRIPSLSLFSHFRIPLFLLARPLLLKYPRPPILRFSHDLQLPAEPNCTTFVFLSSSLRPLIIPLLASRTYPASLRNVEHSFRPIRVQVAENARWPSRDHVLHLMAAYVGNSGMFTHYSCRERVYVRVVIIAEEGGRRKEGSWPWVLYAPHTRCSSNRILGEAAAFYSTGSLFSKTVN